MKTRVSAAALKTGDIVNLNFAHRLRCYDNRNVPSKITVRETHHFGSIELGGCYTPKCVLIVFTDENTLSVEPHEKFELTT